MPFDRRHFICMGTSCAVAAMGLKQSAEQSVPTPARKKTRTLDFHSHAFPADLLRALGRYYPEVVRFEEDRVRGAYAIHASAALPAWDAALRTRRMDEAGVDIEILSCPPLYTALDGHLPELCRLANDTLAESCRRYPDRFKALAHLPFNNMDALLKE